ncbi:MAG: hypothetical protein M0R80_03630 [Proteobacteria bacterium]|nr:hypothetical protein [Pseudomonadota bacterium]
MVDKIKPGGFTWTSGEDIHNEGKHYIHMSLYVGGLSSEDRDELFEWVKTKFDINKKEV